MCSVVLCFVSGWKLKILNCFFFVFVSRTEISEWTDETLNIFIVNSFRVLYFHFPPGLFISLFVRFHTDFTELAQTCCEHVCGDFVVVVTENWRAFYQRTFWSLTFKAGMNSSTFKSPICLETNDDIKNLITINLNFCWSQEMLRTHVWMRKPSPLVIVAHDTFFMFRIRFDPTNEKPTERQRQWVRQAHKA